MPPSIARCPEVLTHSPLLVLAVTAGCDVTAYHVDHGLRPGSSDEAAVVARAASAVGAEFVSLRVDLPPGPNLEARARKARATVLPAGVATGHTADDQAETILLNLLRGAALDGLAGMRPGRQHPILAIRRFETEELVQSLHLEVVRDPTNDDPRFRRNRVRHELLPLATEIAGRDVVALLCRQAALLADDAGLLADLASTIDPTSVPQLAAAPIAIRRQGAPKLAANDDARRPAPRCRGARAHLRCHLRRERRSRSGRRYEDSTLERPSFRRSTALGAPCRGSSTGR